MKDKVFEKWEFRNRAIRVHGKNDYAEIAKFQVTRLHREQMANDCCVNVNNFIKRMIKRHKDT